MCEKILQCNHVLYFQEHVWDASHYLVRMVFSGLKEMFTGTREIQVGSLHQHEVKCIPFSHPTNYLQYKLTLACY